MSGISRQNALQASFLVVVPALLLGSLVVSFGVPMPVQAQAQTPPVFFKISGAVTNGDQFDTGTLQGYSFDTSTGGGEKSRDIPDSQGWGKLSVSTSIGSSSATVITQGSMDPVNASMSCGFYGCGWDATVGASSLIDVYVLGNPGTKFHLDETETGNLDVSVPPANPCAGGTSPSRAFVSWAGAVQVAVETQTVVSGGICGSAPVSKSKVVDGVSALTPPPITYSGQTYSYADSVSGSLYMVISHDQNPFTAHAAGNVNTSVNVTLGSQNLAVLSGNQQSGSIANLLPKPLVVKFQNSGH
jgi:hypothetical protein